MPTIHHLPFVVALSLVVSLMPIGLDVRAPARPRSLQAARRFHTASARPRFGPQRGAPATRAPPGMPRASVHPGGKWTALVVVAHAPSRRAIPEPTLSRLVRDARCAPPNPLCPGRWPCGPRPARSLHRPRA
jgi:hypothetical protein